MPQMPARPCCPGRPRTLAVCLAALVCVFCAPAAQGVQVQDIVRIKGSETSKIVGMGLVVGLSGTGDGGDFAPAMRSLAEVVGKLMDPTVVAAELADAENVALVTLSAELPAEGVREGDRVDVHVSALRADSLAGGRLFLIPMIGPQPDAPVYAFAEGPITLENPDVPTVGVVPGGAQLTRDVMAQYMDQYGQLQLVINPEVASWPVANNLASLINGIMSPDGPNIARAIDQKNVVVQVPMFEREDPASFISQILQSFIEPTFLTTGARVVINERTGTIVVSGDVQISPVIISHKGLTITTLLPPPEPTPIDPVQQEQRFIAVDPERRGGAKLADLLTAFNQLKVEAQDRIEILKLIARSGKLHAQLVLE